MGEIAKKIIGIIAAAAAAPIVTMFTDMAKVESASRDDKANVPDKSRRPIAETSVMIMRQPCCDVAGEIPIPRFGLTCRS